MFKKLIAFFQPKEIVRETVKVVHERVFVSFSPDLIASRWDEEDARYVQIMLASAAGQKMVAKMSAKQADLEGRAVNDISATQYSCGKAAGYRLALSDIYGYTAADEEQESLYEVSSKPNLGSLG